MPIARVGVETAWGPTADDEVTVDVPAGVGAGDLMVAFVGLIGVVDVIAPAGWTPIDAPADAGSNLRVGAYVRTASGSEPADYTWELGSNRKYFGCILAYSGVDSVSPVAAHAKATDTNTDTISPSGVLVPGSGWLLTAAAGRYMGTPVVTWSTSDSSDTEHLNLGSDAEAAQNITAAVWDSGELAGGSTTRTLTASGTLGLLAAWAVALAPDEATTTWVPWTVGAAQIGVEADS